MLNLKTNGLIAILLPLLLLMMGSACSNDDSFDPLNPGSSNFIVSTLVDDFPGNDGLQVHPNGDIYVNSNGATNQWNGNSVHKVTPEGEVSLVVEGVGVWPIGIDFDSEGDLYVSSWDGTVSKVMEDGSIEVILSDLTMPGGLDIDENDHLFLMANSKVWTLIDGELTLFAEGSPLNSASGITYDESSDVFYVSNWGDGVISKVQRNGTMEVFIQLPVGNLGPIQIFGNYLYVTSPIENRVFRVDISAKTFLLMGGNGSTGNTDGSGHLAEFNFPVGVGVSHDGSKVYVADRSSNRTGRLRVIESVE